MVPRKSKIKYEESFSVGDATCSGCGKQEVVCLTRVGDHEYCPSCIKTEHRHSSRIK